MTPLIVRIVLSALFIFFLTSYDYTWDKIFKGNPSSKSKLILFILLILVTIAGNSYFAWDDYNTGDQKNKDLLDSIKVALGRAKLKYDVVNNSIIDDHSQSVLDFRGAKDIHLTNVDVEGTFNNGASTVTKLFSHKVLSALVDETKLLSSRFGLRKVLIAFNDSKWQNRSNQLADTLEKNGYVFIGNAKYSAIQTKNAIDFETTADHIIILLPDKDN